MKLLSGKSRNRRLVPTMAAVLYVSLFCIIVLVGVVWAYSPGEPGPLRDETGRPAAGSISEKVFVNINGVQQGMIIRGRNTENPLLLFVHGGPCFSEYFLADKFPTGLEGQFTVCYWDQRGGGLSYDPGIPLETINLDQLKLDTLAVTQYLCHRFGKEKIYLMAHSGGTAFAIQAAFEEPQHYYAYIGISQIARQAESEKLAYQYMMNRYLEEGNRKMVRKLQAYPIPESDAYVLPFFKSPLRDQSMHELGIGTMRNMRSVFRGVFIPVMACKAYTFKEKANIWISKGSFIRKTALFDHVLSLDLTTKVTELEIPVYFFSGAYDLTVNHDLAKSYMAGLKAPVKGFYTFAKSAHSPNFEEPDKMLQIIQQDVMQGTNELADKN